MTVRVNPEIVGLCTPGAHLAVAKAMQRAHDSNPVKFHRDRPMMKTCPYPVVTGVDVDEEGNETKVWGKCSFAR